MKDSRQDTICSSWYKSIPGKQKELEDKILSFGDKYYILLGIVSQCDHCLSQYKEKIGDGNHQSTEERMERTKIFPNQTTLKELF